MPDWQSCEGQLLDGKHPLDRYVSGDDNSAVFLTASASAIRIRRAAAAQTAALAARWNSVKRLRHPHLLEIESAGTSTLSGEPVAYLVVERAEQNLAEILQDRPLTTDEAREMVLPVAGALDYLHKRGMAHGDVTASNIVAIGSTVKLSSESVGEGDPKADIRALGLILVDALTPKAEAPGHGELDGPAKLPVPFSEVVEGCLNGDSAQQWTADQVVTRLRSPEGAGSPLPAPPAQAKPVTARPRLPRLAASVGLLAVGLAVMAGVVLRRTDSPSSPSPAPAAQPQRPPAAVAPEPAPTATTPAPKADLPAPPKREAEPTRSTRDRQVVEGGVERRVLPDIPDAARNTIRGGPAIIVRVAVDGAGNVTQATIERSFSPYFSRFALEAARQWKFVPEEGANSREWTLRFVFTQKDTQVTAQRATGK
jgi:TonB family protein